MGRDRRRGKQNAPAAQRSSSLAFLGQAREYFVAASAPHIVAARPVLLYYCFMNLAKTYLATYHPTMPLSEPKHGLSEKLGPGGRELHDASLNAYRYNASYANLFDMLHVALTGQAIPAAVFKYDLTAILPQIISGHRLWARAVASRDRFIAVEEIEFVVDAAAKELWTRILIPKGDLTRLNLSRKTLLVEADLSTSWHEVDVLKPEHICFEQTTATPYSHIPSDALASVAAALKAKFWTAVLAQPPYRRYYLYTAPLRERQQVLPQLLSIYAAMYYLGSITRYRPVNFTKILDGTFGAQIHTLLTELPAQFLYMIGSEFAKQEITRPAMID